MLDASQEDMTLDTQTTPPGDCSSCSDPPILSRDASSNLPPPVPSAQTIESNHELTRRTWPFSQPFYTISVKSDITSPLNQVFVRQSTLLRIPYFVQRLSSDGIEQTRSFEMFGTLYHIGSMCLLFRVVENENLPDLIGPDESEDVLELNSRLSDYLRAYPLAGSWGLEVVQNQLVNKLIAYYLDHSVSASDIGLLIRLGLEKSKLCKLLMQELARDIIDGQYTVQPLTEDGQTEDKVDNESANGEQQTGDEGTTKVDINVMADFSSTMNQEKTKRYKTPGLAAIHPPQSQAVSPAGLERCSALGAGTQYLIDPPAKATTNSPAIAEVRNVVLSKDEMIWQQIESTWNKADCTALMAMMVDAHQRTEDPRDRSPIELAAEQPCQYHVHTTTNICPKRTAAIATQRQKRKRAMDEEDIFDDEDSDAEEDVEDDNSSVLSSDLDVIELESGVSMQTRIAEENKENIEPNDAKNVKSRGEREGKADRPLAKNRRLWGLFTR